MKDLILHFGITLGKRNTKKQKQLFIEEVSKIAQSYDWDIEFFNKKKFGFINSHMVIGDLKKAKHVVMAAYDTPTKLLLPNQKYYPFKQEKNFSTDQLNLVLQVIVSSILFIGLYVLVSNTVMWKSWILKTIVWGISFIVFTQLFKLMTGYPNRFNHNRNSASLVVIIDLLKEKSLKNKVAFVLVDKASSGMEGYKDIREQNLIPTHTKTLILDGLASGEILALATSHKFERNAQEFIENFKTDITLKAYKEESSENQIFSYFPSGMMLVSGDRYNNDLVLENTRTKKDYDVNVERLINIRNGIFKSFQGVEK